jgi:thiol-disulfide isomerase/thioredoxin
MSWNKLNVLGALLALAALAPLRADVQAGAAFPALASAGLAGDVPATAGQVLLVDFWASWCAPCKASFPAFARLHAAYAARGLVIVAVSVDEDPAAYTAFVKKFAPPFATVRDAKQQLVRTVNVPTMPTSYLVGPDGKVRRIHSGFHGEETEKALRAEIEAVFAEKAS